MNERLLRSHLEKRLLVLGVRKYSYLDFINCVRGMSLGDLQEAVDHPWLYDSGDMVIQIFGLPAQESVQSLGYRLVTDDFEEFRRLSSEVIAAVFHIDPMPPHPSSTFRAERAINFDALREPPAGKEISAELRRLSERNHRAMRNRLPPPAYPASLEGFDRIPHQRGISGEVFLDERADAPPPLPSPRPLWPVQAAKKDTP